MNKEEHLIEEIKAARETILALTKAIEELSRAANRPTYYPPMTHIYPYRYVGPGWTYTAGGVSHRSSITSGGSFTTFNDGDDDGRVAV